MKLSETLNKVMASPLTTDTTYRNNIDLSGFLLKKPNIIKHDKTGVESCSFILYQLINSGGTLKIDSFSCITYVKELVEQFKSVDKVLFLATVGKLRYSPRVRGDFSQVVEIATLYELDIPLATE